MYHSTLKRPFVHIYIFLYPWVTLIRNYALDFDKTYSLLKYAMHVIHNRVKSFLNEHNYVPAVSNDIFSIKRKAKFKNTQFFHISL